MFPVDILTDILASLNITTETLNNDYIFIKLPFEYSKINKLPLPSYLGEGGETVSVSMTVESFV